MKPLVCLLTMAQLVLAAQESAKNPHKLRLKGDPIPGTRKAAKSTYQSFGWSVKYAAFCRCQGEIYDSFEDIIVAPRVDLVTWSRCDEFANEKRKPQVSYQGSPHAVGLLAAMNQSGAYSLKLELAKEIAAKDKTKNSRKYFGAGDLTFKFTRRSEWNFDMDLEVQSETEPFKESFTIKTLNKLTDTEADRLIVGLLQSTVTAYNPDLETTPGKLKDLIGQCRVHMKLEDEPIGSDGAKRVQRLKKLKKAKTLELFRETYTTCFRSEELKNLPDSPFALIEKCFDSVPG